jgi:hypothetical protein
MTEITDNKASGKIDVIFRWCHPSQSSGNGIVQRSRDNKELYYSIFSLRNFTFPINNIYVLYRGDLPSYKDELLSFHPNIFFIQEQILFNKFLKLYGTQIISNNSEPIKLCFHLIDNIAPYFFSFDDDYYIFNKTDLSFFYNEVTHKIKYPVVIKWCHIPLLFNTNMYAKYIESKIYNMRLYAQSNRTRNDIFQIMIPFFIKQGLALVRTFAKSDHMFIGRLPKVPQITNLNSMFSKVLEQKPHCLTINDDFDSDKKQYELEIKIVHDFLDKYLLLKDTI